jgi:hypothetical protein
LFRQQRRHIFGTRLDSQPLLSLHLTGGNVVASVAELRQSWFRSDASAPTCPICKAIPAFEGISLTRAEYDPLASCTGGAWTARGGKRSHRCESTTLLKPVDNARPRST